MSNLPAVAQTDMNEVEQTALTTFVEAGLPGISRVSDSDVYSWFNLYMSGKSYGEIAILQNSQVEKVLFIAKKYDWFNKKISHLTNVHSKIQQRLQQSQLESASFLSDYIAYIHKKLGGNINRFLAGDLDAAQGVTQKDLDKYFKAIEQLGKLMPQNPSTPAAGPGSTVVVNNGGTVNVGDPVAAAKEVKNLRPFKQIAAEKRAAKASTEKK